MKFLVIIFFALTLSGCKTIESVLTPKTPEQKFAEKETAWAIGKSSEVGASISQRYPLFVGGKLEHLNQSEFEMLRAKFDENISEIKTRALGGDLGMKELRNVYESMQLSVEEASKTQEYIQSRIEISAEGYDDDLSTGLSSYSVNEKAVSILKAQLYSDYPEIREYTKWVTATANELPEMLSQIADKGLEHESSQYLSRARKSGCPEVRSFNFWGDNFALSRSVPYSGEVPEVDSVYDLAGFKVLQSTNDGILLQPNYSDAYNAQPIFIQTGREYVDGFTFRGGDQLVCFTGKMKKYSSILGANRKIYSFKAISDSNEYYFVPWGK